MSTSNGYWLLVSSIYASQTVHVHSLACISLLLMLGDIWLLVSSFHAQLDEMIRSCMYSEITSSLFA